MKIWKKQESGTVMIMFALFLLLMLGFSALGTEAGRWFLIRAELSKTVDAAALVGAKNISNPRVTPTQLALEFCTENFGNGYLGTPNVGAGSATFNVQMMGTDRIQVHGHVSAVAILARVLGFDLIPISSSGVGQKRMVEIMLVLDRSGSMSGTPLTDLKTAAKTFVDYFAATQNEDKLGLITFATSVRVDRAIGTNFVTPMKTAITAMTADNYTNAEDAIAQADGPSGFTNTAGVQKFLIFFSDGQPTCFRGDFIQGGVTYDAVLGSSQNCQGTGTDPDRNLYDPARENMRVGPGTDPEYTGDGINACQGVPSTRWLVFDTYPPPGYAPTFCKIPRSVLGPQVCNLASGLALMHGQDLKNQGVTIYTIGLGNENVAFLTQLASNTLTYYSAPTSADLRQVFQDVAEEIKLRLVQ
jgi:hypothetical protein